MNDKIKQKIEGILLDEHCMDASQMTEIDWSSIEGVKESLDNSYGITLEVEVLIYEGIKVGDKVHTSYGSDAYPGTVVSVNKTGKSIVVQSDNYEYDQSKGEEGKGMGHQNWVIKRNEDGPTQTYTWRKRHGRDFGYLTKGSSPSAGSRNQVNMGWRYYYDWSF
jgi:hypothetical protein